MKKIIVIVLFFNSYLGFSQNEVSDYVTLRDQLKVYNENGQISNSKLDGSPYLIEEFSKGKLLQEGKNDVEVFFRYNVLKDIVEIKQKPNQNEIFILPRTENFEFQLPEYSFFLKKMITKEGEVISGYHIKYYESDDILFIGEPKSRITTAQAATTSYERDKPSKIIINMDYYLSLNGNPLTEVRLKEKDFKKILKNSSDLKEYFKEQKMKEIDDFKEMLKFYETIN
ncbi:hypothetical protein [Gillisia marina]|uniref:hypothetical protein n=1 Tax=Gillisia marina TaxID=1167637 RepID=UPI0003180B1C|nr:hypothetical protein [Gillisia marina]